MELLLPLVINLVPALAKMFMGSQASDVATSVMGIASKIFGTNDPAAIQAAMTADQTKLEAFKAELTALSVSDQAQIAVNTAEASSPSLFVAGWRPFIGWVCGAGLTYQFLLFPFVSWFSAMGHVSPPPVLDVGTLSSLITGMLGLAGMRSYEKMNNADTTSIKPISFPIFSKLRS